MNANNPDPTAILAMMGPMILFFWLIGAAIIVVPFWHIFKKAGMTPALSFLMLVPLVNLIMIYVLAFSQWKTYPPSIYPPAGYPPSYPPPPPPYPMPPQQ